MNDKAIFLILIASIAVLIISFIIAYTNLKKQVKALTAELLKVKSGKANDEKHKNKSREPKQPSAKKAAGNTKPSEAPRTKKPAKPNPEPKQKQKPAKRVEELLTNEIKARGSEFEKFVTQRLGKNHYFKLKGWRGSIETTEGETLGNQQPDFVYEHVIAGKFRRFAVDCMWFAEGDNCRINNFNTLKAYEIEKSVPVFLIVGFGGTVTKPEILSIVPLNEMTTDTLDKATLNRFRKSIITPFHYDVNVGILSEAPRKNAKEAKTV